MDRTRAVGVAVTALGAAGYVAGVARPYPGRAFSVTAVMVGLTLVGVGGAGNRAEGARE